MNQPFLAQTGREYIIERIYYDKALSIENIRKVFVQAARDYINGDMDDRFFASVASALQHSFADFEDIYTHDPILGGLLHDAEELGSRLTAEQTMRLLEALKSYIDKGDAGQ